MEVYRFPTLDALGYIRFAVQIDDEEPIILHGEPDAGVGSYDWEEGIFNGIFKHKFNIDIKEAGKHTIKVYFIDPFIVLDKMVIYTDGYKSSYLGPRESYNTTYNNEMVWQELDPFYQSKYLPDKAYDVTDPWGSGYVVEQNGKLLIEAEYASEETEFSYTTNKVNGGWILARNLDGYTMRTQKHDVNYTGQPQNAPTLNYQVIINNPGSYYVWLRYNAPFPSGDSFGFGVDGQQVFDRQGGLFSWNREEAFEWRRIDVANLRKGLQTINIFAQEDGFIIDKIYLTRTNENPETTNPFSIRTPYYALDATFVSDLNLRTELKSSINLYANDYLNINYGTNPGDYKVAEHDAYQRALNEVFVLYNQSEALDAQKVNDATLQLKNAYDALIDSKVLSDGPQNYLLYETYEQNRLARSPFGLKISSITGAVNTNIYRDEVNYLAVRTFNENLARIQSAELYYDLLRPATNDVVFETRVRYNEGRWGNIMYISNERNQVAIALAFENSNGPTKDIVTYDLNSKVRLAKYEYNKWVSIKVVANVNNNTFDVYIDNKKVNERPLQFRNPSMTLNQYRFGAINSVDSNLGIDYIKVYEVNDVLVTSLEDLMPYIHLGSPTKYETKLTMPSVPDGYNVEISSVSNVDVIKEGIIHIPYEDTTVNVVLKVSNDLGEYLLTEPLTIVIPGVSQEEVSVKLIDEANKTETAIRNMITGTELGLYSETIKQSLTTKINSLKTLETNYTNAQQHIEEMHILHNELLSSRVLVETTETTRKTYYVYEDFNHYVEGTTPFGIEYLGRGTNTHLIKTIEDSNYYHLTTGRSSQAYNKVKTTELLSGKVVAEVGLIDNSIASGSFTNLIFLMTEASQTPVLSVALDRPSSTTLLKYHDGSGWRYNTTQDVSYTPSTYVTVKLVIDIDLGRYDVYYNDNLVYQNISFRLLEGKDTISSLMFGTTKGNQDILFDYIKVYKEASL